jgi:N-acetylmuramoyl-L-alanine amidase
LTEQKSRGRGWVAILFIVAFMLGVGYVIWLSVGAPVATPTQVAASDVESPVPQPTETNRPTRTPRPTQTPIPSPTPTPTPRPPKVGIVAGHWKNDSGAVCEEDGLTEVSINIDVAARVVAILELEHGGYEVELLPEYSEKLGGYEADVFVSIHADSCMVPDASGFKVARVEASAIPEEEDRLVACLIQEYGEATGLNFHANTITFDMRDYHAFNEIAPETPGAIIELGFMGADRELLIDHSDKVAQGVARGILCFLQGN